MGTTDIGNNTELRRGRIAMRSGADAVEVFRISFTVVRLARTSSLGWRGPLGPRQSNKALFRYRGHPARQRTSATPADLGATPTQLVAKIPIRSVLFEHREQRVVVDELAVADVAAQ